MMYQVIVLNILKETPTQNNSELAKKKKKKTMTIICRLIFFNKLFSLYIVSYSLTSMPYCVLMGTEYSNVLPRNHF